MNILLPAAGWSTLGKTTSVGTSHISHSRDCSLGTSTASLDPISAESALALRPGCAIIESPAPGYIPEHCQRVLSSFGSAALRLLRGQLLLAEVAKLREQEQQCRGHQSNIDININDDFREKP